MNVIWFIHVPKTGGTSINTFCKKNTFNHSKYFSYSHDTYSEDKESQLSSEGELYKITCLRDPILHTKSLYSYIKSNKSHHLNKDAARMSFSEWIRFRGADDFYNSIENFYISFFDPKNKDINTCVDILSDFKILKTENLNNDFNDFLESIGEDKSFDIHNMKSNSDKTILSDNDIDYLKKIREQDYKLLGKLGL